jgi:Ni/Co efflux regulator RcnB
MKSKNIVCLIAAASMGIGSVSLAQGYDRHDNNDRRDDQRHEQRWDNNRHDQRAMGNREARGHDRWDRQDSYYYGARGPEWRRGGRLPAQYRDHQYVVDNWRAHHLSAPPRGYHWVQVGNDYVLAAIATGLIAQLLLNNNAY